MKTFLLYLAISLTAYTSASAQALWQNVPTPFPTPIPALAHNGAGVLAVGTINQGVYISEDNGATWNPKIDNGAGRVPVASLLYLPDGTLLIGSGPDGFAGIASIYRCTPESAGLERTHDFAPSDPVSALVRNSQGVLFGSVGDSVFRSSNDGDDWSGFRVATPGVQPLIRDLALAPDDRLFAAGTTGIFHSDDNAETWTITTSEIDGVSSFNVIAVHPSGAIYVGSRLGGAFRSTDGGDTWRMLNGISSEAKIYSMFIVNPDLIFVGTYDRGVFRSNNGGDNWESFNRGFPLNSRVGCMLLHNDNRIYATVDLINANLVRTILPVTSVRESHSAIDRLSALITPDLSAEILRIQVRNWSGGDVMLQLYNAMGRLVASEALRYVAPGAAELSIRNPLLQSGLYHYRIGNYVRGFTGTMMIIK